MRSKLVRCLHSVLAATFVVSLIPALTSARDQIRIVGSSTVYPFATVVAEEFGRRGDFKTPIIESTGTGTGAALSSSVLASTSATRT
jgi:phosphate transport system substrate-binding protein